MTTLRTLYLVLGDQLDPDSTLFAEFDPAQDAIWMAEVADESTHVWSHKARTALFLSAMRHYADAQRTRGWTMHYAELGRHQHASLGDALAHDVALLQPAALRLNKPGDWRVEQALLAAAEQAKVSITIQDDDHFYCSTDDFAAWAKGKKSLRMEFFYRWMRQRSGVLMQGKQPAGGKWNFDADNRGAFDAQGPTLLPAPVAFAPDAITQTVIDLVRDKFAAHPGELDDFDWPVTPAQADAALKDFVDHRLVGFGRFQDAMWTDEPWLYHARLSAALNLKLLNPRRVVDAVESAYRAGRCDLAAAEGFVRQVLGWREFVRGVYWLRMPDFARENALDATAALPDFYWTGDTDMQCLRQAIGQTLRYGYAHHIQRLMVTGVFALMLGVRPEAVHAWYLAVYVDAVEWVELPNTLGMSQYADDGQMVSKPYCASGKYIQRMGNYCANCRYKPAESVGPDACPFTTLYWDFLRKHEAKFRHHPRAALQWRALDRLDSAQREAIAKQALALRERLAVG